MATSPAAHGDFQRLLDQDVDELTVLLAQSDPDSEETLYSFEAAREWGEMIMDQMSGKLHAAVCEEWGYCKRREGKGFDDDVTLAVAIADVIFKAVGVYPVAVVASILVKKGLDAFCGCKRD